MRTQRPAQCSSETIGRRPDRPRWRDSAARGRKKSEVRNPKNTSNLQKRWTSDQNVFDEKAGRRRSRNRFMRTLIKRVLGASEAMEQVVVKGWVRTRRDSKGFSFLELNDGSCLANLQVVVDAGTPGAEQLAHFTTGASAVVEGKLVASPAQGQKWELRARRVELVGSGGCRRIRCRRKATRRNFCGRLPTCVRARICTARCSACAAGWRSRCTSFFRSAILFMSTRRLSRPAIAKERARCFASLR